MAPETIAYIEEHYTTTFGPRSGGAIPISDFSPPSEPVEDELRAMFGSPHVSDTGAGAYMVDDVRPLHEAGCDPETVVSREEAEDER